MSVDVDELERLLGEADGYPEDDFQRAALQTAPVLIAAMRLAEHVDKAECTDLERDGEVARWIPDGALAAYRAEFAKGAG
jgi:hypothetical protein